MQSPIGKQSTSKTLHNVSESFRDSAGNVVSDLSHKASRLADETTETAEEFYNRASSWLQQNYGKTLGFVGLFAAVGAIGYFIVKKSNRSEIQDMPSRKAQ